jgi:hypothetical protein
MKRMKSIISRDDEPKSHSSNQQKGLFRKTNSKSYENGGIILKDLELLNQDLTRISISLEDGRKVSRYDIDQLQEAVSRISIQLGGIPMNPPLRRENSSTYHPPPQRESRPSLFLSSETRDPINRRKSLQRSFAAPGNLLRKTLSTGSSSGSTSSAGTVRSKNSIKSTKTPPPAYVNLVKFTWKDIIDAVERHGDLLVVCNGIITSSF